MAETSIQWTDRTWNPVRGCALVSEGCRNCYAMKQAHRFHGPRQPYEGLTKLTSKGPTWTGAARFVPEKLGEPLTWRKPARVFVNSMSDLFHDDISNEQIAAVFGVMAACPQHTFQVLTKRPSRMLEWFRWMDTFERVPHEPPATVVCEIQAQNYGADACVDGTTRWPLPNVWLGVSCENQEASDERIPLLLQCPAAVRFVSAEPLLGPIDFEAVPIPDGYLKWKGVHGVLQPTSEKQTEPDDYVYWSKLSAKLDWVIVGGESGPGARPCDVAWIRGIVEQCKAASVPVFVKQLGSVPHGFTPGCGDGFTDRKGGDPEEWPEDLRIREFPVVQPC